MRDTILGDKEKRLRQDSVKAKTVCLQEEGEKVLQNYPLNKREITVYTEPTELKETGGRKKYVSHKKAAYGNIFLHKRCT